MGMTNRIKIMKADSYKRFNLTTISVDINYQGDVVIEFCEDVEQQPTEVIFYDNDQPEVVQPEYSHIREIQFGATLSANRLSDILARLQTSLEEYIDFRRNSMQDEKN